MKVLDSPVSFPPTASKPMTWFCAFTFGSSSCVVSRRSAPSSPHDVPPEMARSFDWHSLGRWSSSVDVRVGHADGLRPHGHRADHAGRTCGARRTGRRGSRDPAAPPALRSWPDAKSDRSSERFCDFEELIALLRIFAFVTAPFTSCGV